MAPGTRAGEFQPDDGAGSGPLLQGLPSLQTRDVMLVGEQPGDQEDLSGKPFVGPAGKMLDRALADAGIERNDVYVTNTVKHFKWEPRGKRRIHQKPNSREIAACQPVAGSGAANR